MSPEARPIATTPPVPSDTARIFVQIPSYRDRECQWTVRDLFDKARHPERVFVGICWQFDPEADADCFEVEACPAQVRRIDFSVSEAKGLGWARLQAQSLWRGEEFTLQIDSHMRFVEDWDVKMLAELAACPSRWPVLTMYPAGYQPPDKLENVTDAHRRVQSVDGFRRNGLLQYTISWTPEGVPAELPKLTAGLAGGFVFGASRMIEDVPSDPNIYFDGEEPNLAVRLWTYGFDLFSPRTTLLYHYYRRSDGRRLWDDANPDDATRRSLERMRQLLEPQPGDAARLGRFGLGTARSLADYERFAGVDFRAKSVSSHVYHYPYVHAEAVTAILARRAPLLPADDTHLFMLGDEGVLFSGERKSLCRLNEIATFCWCALTAGMSPDQICTALAERTAMSAQEAARFFNLQVTHWQTWGVLRHGEGRALALAREFMPAPQQRWAIRPPLDAAIDRQFRLPGIRLTVRSFDPAYMPMVDAVFGQLPPWRDDDPCAVRGAEALIQIFSIGGYMYVVRDDCFPARMVSPPEFLGAALVQTLADVFNSLPGSLLHCHGALFDGAGDSVLILGEQTTLGRVMAALPGPLRGHAGGLAERIARQHPRLLEHSAVAIARDDGSASDVTLPLVAPESLLASLPADWIGDDAPPLVPGLEGGNAFIPRFGAPARLKARPVARIVRVVIDPDLANRPRFVPLSPADTLGALIRNAHETPGLESVEQAARMVAWVEARPGFELRVADPSQVAAALSAAAGAAEPVAP